MTHDIEGIDFESTFVQKIPLSPPFSKEEIESLPFIKGDLEGFLRNWLMAMTLTKP